MATLQLNFNRKNGWRPASRQGGFDVSRVSSLRSDSSATSHGSSSGTSFIHTIIYWIGAVVVFLLSLVILGILTEFWDSLDTHSEPHTLPPALTQSSLSLGLEPPEVVHPLEYTLLDQRDSVRLLTLLPGAMTDSIECTLNTTTLKEYPSYQALSYQWEAQSGERWIRVNQADLRINASLYNALRYLRKESEAITLWTDAICINQDPDQNNTEKSHQVSMMTEIYEGADKVIVWLGPFEQLYEGYLRAIHEFLAGNEERWSSIQPLVRHLIHLEYWKRAWIVQEITVANHNCLVVRFGPYELIWNDFVSLVRGYHHRVPDDKCVAHILKLVETRQTRYYGQKGYYLSTLLSNFRDTHCGQWQDKIFAFIGMAHDHFRGDIPVDYSVEPEARPRLYADVIRFESASDLDRHRKKVEMVYFSGLLRQLLTRQATSTDEGSVSDHPTTDLPTWMHRRATRAWLPAGPENRSIWDPETLPEVAHIHLRCSLRAKIVSVGPSVRELRGDTGKENDWKRKIATYSNNLQLPIDMLGPRDFFQRFKSHIYHKKKLVEVNVEAFDARGISISTPTLERLPYSWSILGAYIKRQTKTWSAFPVLPEAHVFLGDQGESGLVPSNAQANDYICAFWNTSAAALLRGEPGSSLKLIGRASMSSGSKFDDWLTLLNPLDFEEDNKRAVDFEVNLKALTRLSLDTVQLPYTV